VCNKGIHTVGFTGKIDIACYERTIIRVEELQFLGVFGYNVLFIYQHMLLKHEKILALTSLLIKRFLGRFDLLNLNSILIMARRMDSQKLTK
jgi:hypothetical protein